MHCIVLVLIENALIVVGWQQWEAIMDVMVFEYPVDASDKWSLTVHWIKWTNLGVKDKSENPKPSIIFSLSNVCFVLQLLLMKEISCNACSVLQRERATLGMHVKLFMIKRHEAIISLVYW